MKTRILTCLVFFCFGWTILGADGHSATAWQKPKTRQISSLAPAFETDVSPISANKYPTGGTNYNTSCTDILPGVGTIIQHDQIGDTWYDVQKEGSMGRMISVTSGGYRHFSWMYVDHPYPPGPRYVDANCKDPTGGYLGQTHADGSSTTPYTNAGYCNQAHLHDGTSVIVHHRATGSPEWYSTLTMDNGLCSGLFDRHWDIPDYITNAPPGLVGMHPQAGVLYDATYDRDYIHMVMTEGNIFGGELSMVAYERCYLGLNDTMICQTFEGGSTKTYKIAKNVNGPGTLAPIGYFDSSCLITPVVAVSPLSQRVAIAFLKPTCDGNCDYLCDACYIESMNNGDDWIAGSPWPPPEYNITNFGCTGNERCFFDLNTCYDYQDSLHIVYVTCGFDPANPGYFDPHEARLYHWSKKSGVTMITSAIWSNVEPGYMDFNIAKMSISAQDPLYHPGGDSVYLYAIWTQYDTADYSASGFTNGELYGSGSFDGGQTWGRDFNLTNTRTPGCAPGSCLSEHWSSLAQNMYNGDLHIQYICDRDAGWAMRGSEWTDNPVMYLHLTEWSITAEPQGAYRIESPPKWFGPPLKVLLNGSRNLIFKVFSLGNAGLTYSVTSDKSCIQVNVPPTVLPPGDSAAVTIILSGGGSCSNTFINGNVILHTNESGGKNDSLPVQAVVANDYYECPNDPVTFDTLENGILRFYTNANCQEWIHDIGTRPDTTYEVFYNGGTIIATTRSGDTLVGRYMGQNDQHALAGDKLYTDECDVTWEPDFWIVYTKNIFMHDLNPPMDAKWFWWEMSKQIKFFQPSAPELYKHLVVNYITVKRHDPPIWWPSQPPFTGYEDTYIGVAEDIDCPYDTFDMQNGRNLAGYDATKHIAWQRGWDYTGAHPQYNNYYCGMALANGGLPGESIIPYGSYNVRNDVYLYPQGGWGWKDGELYRLSATAGPNIQSPDSIVDRSQVFTARKINAGNDPNASYSFTVVEGISTTGLAGLQTLVDTARAIVTRETSKGYPIICGDLNGDGKVDVGDIIGVINYLFKGSPISSMVCPAQNRANVNGSADGIEVGDIVTLINYVFKGASASTLNCPGIWGP